MPHQQAYAHAQPVQSVQATPAVQNVQLLQNAQAFQDNQNFQVAQYTQDSQAVQQFHNAQNFQNAQQFNNAHGFQNASQLQNDQQFMNNHHLHNTQSFQTNEAIQAAQNLELQQLTQQLQQLEQCTQPCEVVGTTSTAEHTQPTDQLLAFFSEIPQVQRTFQDTAIPRVCLPQQHELPLPTALPEQNYMGQQVSVPQQAQLTQQFGHSSQPSQQVRKAQHSRKVQRASSVSSSSGSDQIYHSYPVPTAFPPANTNGQNQSGHPAVRQLFIPQPQTYLGSSIAAVTAPIHTSVPATSTAVKSSLNNVPQTNAAPVNATNVHVAATKALPNKAANGKVTAPKKTKKAAPKKAAAKATAPKATAPKNARSGAGRGSTNNQSQPARKASAKATDPLAVKKPAKVTKATKTTTTSPPRSFFNLRTQYIGDFVNNESQTTYQGMLRQQYLNQHPMEWNAEEFPATPATGQMFSNSLESVQWQNDTAYNLAAQGVRGPFEVGDWLCEYNSHTNSLVKKANRTCSPNGDWQWCRVPDGKVVAAPEQQLCGRPALDEDGGFLGLWDDASNAFSRPQCLFPSADRGEELLSAPIEENPFVSEHDPIMFQTRRARK